MLPIAYALRNLWRRRARTLVTFGGVALISALVILMGGFARGLQSTAEASASSEVAVLTGSTGEHDLVRSVITRADAEAVAANVPGVLEIGDRRATSLELHVATRKGRMIGLLRGVTPGAFLVHRQVTVVEGREPRAENELLAGRLAETRMGLPDGALDVGRTIDLEGTTWTVVGRFAAPGTVLEAEMWGRLDDVAFAARRQDLSVVALRFPDAEAVEDAMLWVFRNGAAYEVTAIPETEIYKTFQEALDPIAALVALMAILVLVGGVVACANTMVAAVLARTREIGTLRAIGYGPFAVGASLLQEALLLGLAGGLVGFFAAGLVGEVRLKFPMGAFFLDLSPEVRLVGLASGVLAGVVGGLVPALRAARLPLTDALAGKA